MDAERVHVEGLDDDGKINSTSRTVPTGGGADLDGLVSIVLHLATSWNKRR